MSTSPIAPTAQFTDSASVALLQDWIVICAVGLGIAGGMLATLLLEWIRPAEHGAIVSEARNRDLSAAPINTLQYTRWKPRKFKTTHWLVTVGLAFFIGYARGQFRRERS
jgi:hypothetical protein